MPTCLHGFEPGECLICQTLDPGARPSPGRRRAPSRDDRRAAGAGGLPAGGPVEVVDPTPRAAGSRTGGHILVALVLVMVGVIVFWTLAGVVLALLRLLEIVIVAAVAAFLGYRLGRARGPSGH